MNANSSITLEGESSARRWGDLAGSIQDALFDAQHCSAGLQGAKPKLSVLLSRNLLNLDGPPNLAAMQRLCHQLEQQGVAHSFHCAAPGSPEPTIHRVQITLY